MKTPTRSNNNLLFTRVASLQTGTIDPPHSRGFLWFRDDTQRQTTIGRTPLDE